MNSSDDHESFVLQTIQAQGRIHAYILSLVLNKSLASELLQRTNLVLLQKEAEFQPGTNFGAWACTIAYYEVLSERRNKSRDRHVFSDGTLSLLAAMNGPQDDDDDERMQALDACLELLSSEHRDLVMARYRPNGSVTQLAQTLNKTPAAISASLYRIRTTLMECVRRKLQGATA